MHYEQKHKHISGNSFKFYILFLIHSLFIISQTAVYVYATYRILSCLYYLNSYDEDRINTIVTAFKYVKIVYDSHVFSTIIQYKLNARFACQPGL